MKKKQESYEVTFTVKVTTSVPITASSFEDAIDKAREYIVKDIVDFDTDFIDGDLEIDGVFKA